jgi:hypothetical protein
MMIFSSGYTRTVFDNKALFNSAKTADVPYAALRTHNVGKMALSITNLGIIGLGDIQYADPITGESAESLSFPQGYGLNYLYHGDLWIGAVVGFDSLVSIGSGLSYSDVHEFWPDFYPEGQIIHRSTKDPEAPEYDSAISSQDFIAVYFDTITDGAYTGFDYATGEGHRPLNIMVKQKSYAWGYDYAEDFVIFDYEITNIGGRDLEEVYLGLYLDIMVGRGSNYYGGDDICGFQRAVRSSYIPEIIDTINVVWGADNNGDPSPGGGLHGLRSPSSVIGTKILRTPSDEPQFSFNWWVWGFPSEYNWGPRKRPLDGTPPRTFLGALGTPYSDAEKYYIMSQQEFDYNQSSTGYDHTSSGWLPPPPHASQVASGDEVSYLISCGPYQLARGVTVPLTFAIVGGQNFYASSLGSMGYSAWRDFSDMALNTVWATWIYDNPGIDTDGDGDAGEFWEYVYDSAYVELPGGNGTDSGWVATWAETVYYAGDGIPDFRGASPPPAPKFQLYPVVNEYYRGEITLLWNGRISETTPDQFSQREDFEGYRVYISLSERDDDFVLVTSYDKENYNRWEYHRGLNIYTINRQPFDLRELRQKYGDDFNPLAYYDSDHLFSVYEPLTGRIEAYYFTRHDWNQSNLRDTTLIHKVYPDQPYPSTFNLDSAATFYPDELTDEGNLKYFEYRYVLRDLLPSQQYFIALTTFDHGYPRRQLAPQETSPSFNAIREYPQNNARMVEDEGLEVVVYPNPYRIDAKYEDRFEGWDKPDLPKEYNRAIHFTNLPHKCTIRIFSIDGDLIREIDHDYPEGAPGSMHEKWDLITRNTMMTVSGIYYYTIESKFGNQIGKFVIIR